MTYPRRLSPNYCNKIVSPKIKRLETLYSIPIRPLENQSITNLFGIFGCRCKAIDSAKYNGPNAQNAKVILEEVKLNQFEEV